jgi:nucleoside-diphosphate-sugar epimerase
MDVLVTGGNGFVGRHLITELLGRGDSVRVLALPDERTAWLEERGVSVHGGDVREAQTLVAPMRGVQGVVHLAAMMDVWRPIADYRAVNVIGTENVCRAALAARVDRFVHMSSSSVYGMGAGREVDESFPLAPFSDPYPVTKAEGDRLVQRLIVEDRLPAVVIRPDQIFGPGDHLHFGHMADRLRAGRSIVVGSGRNAMPFVYVSDAVQGLLLALDHPRAPGQAYNITNDTRLTQQELLEAIAEGIGARPPRVHVPFRLLYAAGYAMERASAVRGSSRRPPITRLGVAFFGTDNRYAIGKARGELGYAPRVPLREGVRLAATWYRQHQPRAATTAAGAPADQLR